MLAVFVLPAGLACQVVDGSTPKGQISETVSGSARLFQEAQQAMQSGDFSAAQSLLTRLHANLPENFEVNELLGLTYVGQQRLSMALGPLQAAAREKPESNIARANLGAILLKLHRPAEAAHELQAAIRLDPNDRATQENLGQAEMLLGRPAEAAKAFDEALRLDPKDADVAYNDALALYGSGQYARARQVLAGMTGVENSASAQSLYGDVDEELTRYQQAAKHDLRAAQIDPSEANIYVLGVELLRHWTFDPAIKEFAAGIKKYPASRRMKLGLAIAYYGNGNYNQAIPILAKLLTADPEKAEYADLLGRSCTVETQGNAPGCALIVQLAEKHPSNAPLAIYAASSILQRQSSPEELETARRLLQRAVTSSPRSAEAWMETGVLLQTESKWAQSVTPLQTAIRLKPELASAHYRLARAYSHLGKHELAQEQIALDLQYSKSQQKDLNAHLQEVTTFVVKMR